MESDKTAQTSDDEFFECETTPEKISTNTSNAVPETSEERKTQVEPDVTDEKDTDQAHSSGDKTEIKDEGQGVNELTEKIEKTCLDEKFEEGLTQEEKEVGYCVVMLFSVHFIF